MRQYYLAIRHLLHCHLAFIRVRRERDNVRDQLRKRAAVQSAHGQHPSDNGIFVSFRQVPAGQHYLAQEHIRIGAVLPGLRLSVLSQAGHDPAGFHHQNIRIQGGEVVGEVDSVGNDVRVFVEIIYATVCAERYASGASLLEDRVELFAMCMLVVKAVWT